MKLHVENLCKAYVSTIALDHLSITFENGIYGILGPNGAGKSTLMNILSLLLDKTDGNITLDENDIVKMDTTYLDHIGYMPQENCLYDDFTLFESLCYVGVLKGMKKTEAGLQANELAKEVGLADVLHKKIKTYSGGMKKRAMFAQTLMNHPDILILDEPTAGLDPQKRIELRNIISQLSKDKIVLIATHVVSDIEYIANQIVLMNHGKIIKVGSTKDLIQSIDGKVFERCIEEGQLKQLESKYRISNLRYEQGKLIARIITDEAPLENGIRITPDLNDVYLSYFQEIS